MADDELNTCCDANDEDSVTSTDNGLINETSPRIFTDDIIQNSGQTPIHTAARLHHSLLIRPAADVRPDSTFIRSIVYQFFWRKIHKNKFPTL